jgi:hypothetical protein
MILRAVNKSRGVGTEVMAGGYIKYIGAAFTTTACSVPARLLHSSLLRPLDSPTFQQQWPSTDVPFASLFRILKSFCELFGILKTSLILVADFLSRFYGRSAFFGRAFPLPFQQLFQF